MLLVGKEILSSVCSRVQTFLSLVRFVKSTFDTLERVVTR